jgi:hypothetical protein
LRFAGGMPSRRGPNTALILRLIFIRRCAAPY